MKKKYLILIILALLFTRCKNKPELDYIKINFEPKPVVNCIFEPDSTFKIWIGLATNYFSSDTTNIISNVNVFIKCQNGDTIKFNKINEHLFESDSVAKRGIIYNLIVKTEKYGTITAQSYIPSEKPIFDTTLIWPNEGLKTISFTDVYNKENYYELFGRNTYIDSNSVIHLDTINYKFYFWKSNSPIWLKENLDKDHWRSYTSLIFSDKGYENQKINIELKTPVYGGRIYLSNMSRDLFYYKKSIWIFFNNSIMGGSDADDIINLRFNTKIVKIYTNIQNGYGIFAGYNKDAFIQK